MVPVLTKYAFYFLSERTDSDLEMRNCSEKKEEWPCQFLCAEAALMSPPQVAMSLFILTLWDYTPGHRGLQITWGNRIHRTKAVQISVGQGHLREKMPPEKGQERRAGVWDSQGALEAMDAHGGKRLHGGALS